MQVDLPTLALWILVGVAAVWDVAQRRIPNGLILTGLLLGAGIRTQSGGIAGLGFSVLGAAMALAVLYYPFRARLVGGGDVKLAMVCGAFLGWRSGFDVILLGTLLHGLVGLLYLGWRKLAAGMGRPDVKERGVPHAVGFALAVYVLSTTGLHILPAAP